MFWSLVVDVSWFLWPHVCVVFECVYARYMYLSLGQIVRVSLSSIDKGILVVILVFEHVNVLFLFVCVCFSSSCFALTFCD